MTNNRGGRRLSARLLTWVVCLSFFLALPLRTSIYAEEYIEIESDPTPGLINRTPAVLSPPVFEEDAIVEDLPFQGGKSFNGEEPIPYKGSLGEPPPAIEEV